MAPPPASKKYDIVIAGGAYDAWREYHSLLDPNSAPLGGTAGCVVASRLATADPSLQILVIEAGRHTLNDVAHVQPARFIHHILPGSQTVQFLTSNASDSLNGRSVVVPTAHCLGGGSSVNCQSNSFWGIIDHILTSFISVAEYTRASYADFNIWERQYNNPGWGFNDLLPFIKKVRS